MKKQGRIIATVSSPETETAYLPGKINDKEKQKQGEDELRDAAVITKVTPGIRDEMESIDSTTNNISTDITTPKTLEKTADTIADNNSKKSFSKVSKNKWHVGFLVSGGISHVGNQFLGLGQFFGTGSSNADYLQAPGGYNNSGGNPYYAPSEVKNRGGIVAGMFLEKNISSKIKISFGINYKEFNTSNLVGPRNDTTGLYQAARFPQYRHYNNFKFIELPLDLSVQLGKGKTLPIFWSGGITISQLINSNALQFNQYGGNYYKDNSLFNKTQIGLSTGLSAVLFQNQKSSILFGPYIYYSASQLAKEGLYTKKHFVFFGLRSEIIFGKK